MHLKLELTVNTREYLQGIEEMLAGNDEAKVSKTLTRDTMEQLYAQVQHVDCSYMVLEYAAKPNLFEFIQKKPLSEAATLCYMKQLVDALAYMRKSGIVHCDLKPENCLLDGEFKLLLADLGFSVKMNSQGRVFERRGTVNYMAPEVLNDHACNQNGYDPELADVFSLGVIMFVILVGRPPFQLADREKDEFYKLFAEETSEFWTIWENEWAVDNNVLLSTDFRLLFQSMTAARPQDRPRFE